MKLNVSKYREPRRINNLFESFSKKCFSLFLISFFFLQSGFAQQTDLFEYDRSRKITFEEESATEVDKTIVRREIRYESPKGGMVTATLLAPQKKKSEKLAAVIYLHGAGANRTQFLPEAAALVKTGKFIVLLIDLPSARPAPWKKSEYDYLAADRDMRIQTVVDSRRAVDLIETLPDVDATRIGLIGYSYGAATGGILAGIEKRFRAVVLMASGGSQIAFWRDEKNPQAAELKRILKEERFNAFIDTLKPVEQNDYIKTSSAPIFFQFAKRDQFTNLDSMRSFYEAANEPKKVRWYDATHELSAQATADRFSWIKKQLKIRK